MKDCNIVRDLLPLYADNSCSEVSREFVEKHLSVCEACRMLHESTPRTVQPILSHRNAQKSFGAFRRRILTKRILLIALCVLLALCAVLYPALVFSPFMQQEHAIPLEAISTSVSRLSDGSVHILFDSTQKPFKLYYEQTYLLPEDPYTLCIRCYHTYNNDFNLFPFALNRKDTRYIFMTEESAPLYNVYLNNGHRNDVVRKIILVDEENERVLWEKGDILPSASEEAEYRLQLEIESGYIVPMETP